MDQQARGLGPGAQLGEPVRDRLVVFEGLAERLALERVDGGERPAPRAPSRSRTRRRSGRNRSSVCMATRKPAPGSPRTCSGRPARRRSAASRSRGGPAVAWARRSARGCRRESRMRSGREAPAWFAGPREHGVDVGIRRVGDPQLLAAEPVAAVAVGVGRATTAPPRRSPPRARSARTRPPRCRPRSAASTVDEAPRSPPGRSGTHRGPGARTRSPPRCSRGPAPRGSDTARSRGRLCRSSRARTAGPAGRGRPAPSPTAG